MRYAIVILVFNLIFCLGIESVWIPRTALELASGNSGIANSKNIGVNSCSINNIKNSFSASSILWYQGVKGSNINFKWGDKNHHYVNLYNLNATDIGFWDDVPNDNPIDLFDIHHISLGYGFGKNFSNKINIGIKNTIIYNQLYTDESFGYNLDLGFSYSYNDVISFGASINQLGFEKYNNTFNKYPLLIGAGSSIYISPLKTRLNLDVIYNQNLSDELIFKIGSIINIHPSFSFVSGYNYSDSKNELSCGISFKYRKIQFDYGISFHTALGNPTIFSLKYHI